MTADEHRERERQVKVLESIVKLNGECDKIPSELLPGGGCNGCPLDNDCQMRTDLILKNAKDKLRVFDILGEWKKL